MLIIMLIPLLKIQLTYAKSPCFALKYLIIFAIINIDLKLKQIYSPDIYIYIYE